MKRKFLIFLLSIISASCLAIGLTACGHTHNYTYVVTQTANCTEEGILTYTCSICGDVFTVYTDPIGHITSESVIENAVEVTCTTDGSYDSVVYCLVCGEEVSRETTTIKAPGHTYINSWSCIVCGYAEIKASKSLEYVLSSDGTSYTVCGIGKCTDTNIVIPYTYNNIPVTAIADYAFYCCDQIETVTIPDCVETIGDYAFTFCESLKSISIPKSVTAIGDYALESCQKLTNIEVSSDSTSFKSVDGNLYSHDGTKLIQYAAGKTDTTFTIPSTVTTICNGAFSCNESLKSVIIPYGVTSISACAFNCCASLESVTLPNSIKTIEKYAFYSCHSLKSITIPDSVTAIYDSAFYCCLSLESVTIGSGVTYISSDAFEECYNLATVYNSSSLEITAGSKDNGYVAYYATNVYTSASGGSQSDGSSESGNTEKAASEGLDYTLSNGTYTVSGIGTCTDTDIVIPSTYNSKAVTGIDDNAFSSEAITSVTINSGVTDIGDYTFANCSSLESISIPDSLTAIGEHAFYGCTSLKSVSIPDSVETIGDSAFYYCVSLESVSIGNGITNISDWAFTNCYMLTSVNIPNGVTAIGECAFCLCTSLTSISIPSGVKTIGYGAFDSSGLTSVTIPASVTHIDDYAFSECINLTNISVASGNSYYKSTNNVLYSYDGTELMQYGAGITSVSFTIPNNVTSIANGAFAHCYSLQNVTIPSGVISIGENAFYYCESLKSVTIGSSVTSIGFSAFEGCSSLTSITIPHSVTAIGAYAFYETALESAAFENTSGWYRTLTENETTGDNFNSSYLLNEAIAAAYLAETYCYYYWYC